MTDSHQLSPELSPEPSPEPTVPTSVNGASAGVDPRLLEVLVCPVTKTPLVYDADAQELISEQAGLAYPIRDGIPIMLVDEARRLNPETEAV